MKTRHAFATLWILLIAGLLISAPAWAASGSLRAGAAKADISPTKDLFPFNSGQLFGGNHDPLYARALVLDNGSSKVALVTMDAIGVPVGDDLVNAVTAELGIPAANVLLVSTHDHNSPRGNPKGTAAETAYFAIQKKGILQAVREANSKLQAARIGFGTGKAYINTNRDEKIGEAYHMGYVPEGPSDKTVSVVAVMTPAGEPIAIYSNYAVHAVVMFRTHTKDGQIEVSGDIAGATSKYVEDHFKNAVALWTAGAAGDQNPLFMANYNQDHPDVFDEGPAGWAILDVEARRLGEEIVRVTKAVRNTTDTATLWGKQKSVECPGLKRENEPAAGGRGQAPRGPIKMVDGDPVNIPLGLVMINDIALARVSGEVFTEIGMHLKKDSLFDRTMMVTMGPNGVGYIATDKAYLLPAEKTVGNRIKPGCAEPAIVNGFLDLMRDYLEGQKIAQR